MKGNSLSLSSARAVEHRAPKGRAVEAAFEPLGRLIVALVGTLVVFGTLVGLALWSI
jgi:hypothetical protein